MSDDYYPARIPGAPNPLTPLLDDVETRMTPSDLVYHYDPRPVGEPSPAELWWASLKEGDEIPLCNAAGERVGTATLGPMEQVRDDDVEFKRFYLNTWVSGDGEGGPAT